MDHTTGTIARASPPHNDPPTTLYHLSTENRLTRWGVNSLSAIQPASRAPYAVLYAAFSMSSFAFPSHLQGDLMLHFETPQHLRATVNGPDLQAPGSSGGR
jgi:hypothetical protein